MTLVAQPRVEAPAIAVDTTAATVGGIPAADLMTRHGSPLFAYDFDVASARVAALRSVLPPSVDVAYAVKANPSLALLAQFGRDGLGADVASGGELAAVLRAGIPASRIVFTGPGKTDAELVAALKAGIRAITVESLEEVERLIELAASRHAPHPQGVLLRRATNGSDEPTPILGAGGVDKFGLTDDELDEAAARLVAGDVSAALRLDGIHAFGASNVRDADVLADHIEQTVAFSLAHARRHGYRLRLVDVGGGLGIPYADGDAPLDLDRFGARLAPVAEGWAREPALSTTRVLIEPGRFLSGPIGAYLTRIIATKRRHGTTVVIIDGGIHHLLRPVLLGQPNRIRLLGGNDRPLATVTITGPLCTGIDVLSSGTTLPEPRVGDLLAIIDTGAYGFSESMPMFLSHPQPAEVAVRGGQDRLIRPRVEPSDLLERQRLPW